MDYCCGGVDTPWAAHCFVIELKQMSHTQILRPKLHYFICTKLSPAPLNVSQ